jgi:glucose-1-phosphate adenylyltransferase
MKVLAVILAGGRGERLYPLTRDRAKPAVPFGGIYRIIDFTLSNCINSDVRRIFILAQYKSLDLIRHIRDGWNILSPELGEYIEIIPPMKQMGDEWYQGTADAVFQNTHAIVAEGPEYVLILSGDHIYKMNYHEMIECHLRHRADVTIATIQTPPADAPRFGIAEIAPDHRIVGFEEKPQHGEPKRSVFNPDMVSASMGIYVFNTKFLLNQLEEDGLDKTSAHDFGKNIIPRIVEMGKAFAYPFLGYWVDVGTIQAYWETSMALLEENPGLDLYDSKWVIHTRSEERPPVKCIPPGQIIKSMASNGCVIQGTVINSILSPGVCVEKGAVVRDSVIMNDTVIRAGAQVTCCVLDKEIEVGANACLGAGDDNTPNKLEPANIHTGITIAGKRARIPASAVIGRNCRIDPSTTPDDYETIEVPSGGTITKKA